MIWQPIYYVLDFFCSIFLLGLTGNTQPTGLFLMPHTGERAIIYDIPQLHCRLNGARKAERRTRLIGLCRLRRLLGGGVQEKGRKKRKERRRCGGRTGACIAIRPMQMGWRARMGGMRGSAGEMCRGRGSDPVRCRCNYSSCTSMWGGCTGIGGIRGSSCWAGLGQWPQGAQS